MLAAVRPRPVLCVNEHEHRDRALADDASRRALHRRRRDALARPRARLAARRAARRRGVADRVGQVLLRARPRGRVPRRPATGASADAGSGSSASWIVAGAAGPTTPARSPRRRILNWIYAWQRLPEPADGLGGGARREPASTAGAPRARDNLTPRAQPPHARALRAADRRARAARPDDGELLDFAVAELTGTCRPTSAPTACTARRRRTTT